MSINLLESSAVVTFSAFSEWLLMASLDSWRVPRRLFFSFGKESQGVKSGQYGSWAVILKAEIKNSVYNVTAYYRGEKFMNFFFHSVCVCSSNKILFGISVKIILQIDILFLSTASFRDMSIYFVSRALLLAWRQHSYKVELNLEEEEVK